ncbi:MAG TPA: hypothetical protein PKB14_21050 [Rubrivivax sp.]|nr:hypothetical protein [Rubrivivax sp.]
MVRLLNCVANVMLALLALGFVAVLAVAVLLVPWWLSAIGAVALVAAWPAHKRWARAEAEHRGRSR